MDGSALFEKVNRDEGGGETEEEEGVAEDDAGCEAICVFVRDN